MKYLLILTFIFFYNISNGQNCESVKTGVFSVKIKDVEFTVKRTEKREIISSKYGTVKHRIKWLSDCKYILINRRSKLTEKISGDLIIKNSNGKASDTIYNKIIEVSKKGFRIESSEDENLSYKIEYIYLKK